MKNIHIIPTDKSSRIAKNTTGKLHFSDNISESKLTSQNQNIYITSEEEIKEGDWYLDNIPGYYTIEQAKGDWCITKDHKKIILTTDQNLIKDGVQAIDDEFLEWFVKNPSCESIEVENERIIIDNINYNFDVVDYKYKIIIPKEELYSKVQQKSLELNKKFAENSDLEKIMSEFDEPKQETLEEIKPKDIQRIISSTDAQTASIEIVNLFSKWQQERSYSEEEVLELLLKSKIETSNLYYEDMKEWFELNKKK